MADVPLRLPSVSLSLIVIPRSGYLSSLAHPGPPVVLVNVIVKSASTWPLKTAGPKRNFLATSPPATAGPAHDREGRPRHSSYTAACSGTAMSRYESTLPTSWSGWNDCASQLFELNQASWMPFASSKAGRITAT